jgi:signal transduction histidine kinase/ligand-binding sensor domain-containing protein/DNA-binding response OmpR family regulator
MTACCRTRLKLIALLYILIFLACLLCTAEAQTDTLKFTSLSSKDGLSSNIVKAIIKDRYGWMWFATEDGLNRFDGSRFFVYRHGERDPGSLRANDITCLYEDKAGRLWIGTNGGSLNVYDRQNDAFTDAAGFEGGHVLHDATIRSISGDTEGKIWTASFNGLYRIDPLQHKFCPLPAVVSGIPAFANGKVSWLYQDSRGTMWIGTGTGLYAYRAANGSVQAYTHSAAGDSSLVSNDIRAITEDRSGNIWIGTNEGVSMLAPGKNKFRNFLFHNNNAQPANSNPVFAMTADPASGNLWLGTEEGLNILDPQTGKFTHIAPDKRRTYGLTRKSVRSIFIDDRGIYWVGTFQGGVNKFDKNLNLFELKQGNAFDANGLSSSVITCFAEGKDSTVFIGTDGGGLNLFHRKSGLFSHISLPCLGPQASGSLSILTLLADRKGRLWIGTYGKGVFCFDPAGGTCRHLVQGTAPGQLSSNDIFDIKEDRHGAIWIGTNGRGVNVIDPASGRIRSYFDPATNGPRVLNGYIRAIEEDKDGNIWLASHGSGVACINPATGNYHVYNKDNSNLPVNTVYSILCDSRGNIWLGTAGGGLSLFNPKEGRFTSYAEKNGLANAMVYKIVEDEGGQLWISTNTAISSFDAATTRFTNYTQDNGVQKSNFVRGAGIRLRDGELYFGGLDGFNFFNPRRLTQNRNVPAVVFTELRVANQSVGPSAKGPIQEQISIAREISLHYRQSFSLSFAALDYTSSQQNTYAYKLEGFDKDWNYTGRVKTASYTNLDPGDYVFRVKVRNSDGVWNTQGASIRIHIEPPFWRTVYAYVLYAALVIGAFLFYRHLTLQKWKRRFAAEQEKRRVQQLIEQQRKEAEVAREVDQMKIKFLTNLSHEFRTPISLIMGPVDNLLQRGPAEPESGYLHTIRRNAKRLLNLVNQLLDFRKMEENELSLHMAEGEVIAFIKEVFDSFKDLAERKKIRYTFCTGIQQVPAGFDHDKLERILFNLLSNAFKFTPAAGSIQLEVEKEPQPLQEKTAWLVISVSDTGIGISESEKDKIFERFFQAHSPTLLNQGSGIGLSITQEFVKMLGGTIDVKSRPGEGTVFRVRLPFSLAEPAGSENLTAGAPHAAAATPEANGTVADPVKEETHKTVILLVEDDDDFRFYLKDNLKNHYKVIEASNGREGWQKTLAHHPLLVVSDISMPVMDGIQLSNKIKSDKRTSHIPVVLLTALTGDEDQLKGLATGASDYVTKPFNFEILHSKIRNLLLLNHTLKTAYSKQIQLQAPEPAIESADEALLKQVRLYIEEHLTDPQLSVDQLSRQIGMSRSSFYSKMLALTGQTPVEYIRSVKLEKAAVLLEKSGLNVAQVAYETGFASANYFAKAFKAKFNILPSDYANRKRKKAAGS